MNLLNLIQSQFSPQAVGQISQAVGEKPEATKAAIGAALPAVLGSLVGKASSLDGANEIFSMLKPGQNQRGWFDSVSGMLAGFTGSPQPGGGSLLNTLFGSKLGALGEFIASHCGIKSGAAQSILGMAATLLMGTLSKHVSTQGLGPAGLSQFLGSQTQYVKEALPAGLANTLGLGNLFKGPSDMSRIDAENREVASKREIFSQPGQNANVPAAAPLGKILKWAAIPVVALLGILVFANRSHKQAEPLGGTADYSRPDTTGLGVKLPDLSSLQLTPGGTADKIAQAITSGDFSQSFNLQGISADSSHQIAPFAQRDIQEVGSVLRAVPNLKLKIIGYGATEQEGMNSANAIKSVITATGISGDRVMASAATGTSSPTITLVR